MAGTGSFTGIDRHQVRLSGSYSVISFICATSVATKHVLVLKKSMGRLTWLHTLVKHASMLLTATAEHVDMVWAIGGSLLELGGVEDISVTTIYRSTPQHVFL